MHGSKLAVILPLGTTQTLAWASSYYLLAILADPIARDTGMTPAAVFAAFSGSLLISAAIGPRVGKTIDRIGGRLVLILSNLSFALGLGLLAASSSWPLVCAAWAFLGIGMGMGLYDAAFATLGRIYGIGARGPITGITLMAGFASTVGWPLTAWALAAFGWREACLGWALAHLVIGIPLNASLPRTPAVRTMNARPPAADAPRMDRTMWLLAIAFTAGWIVATAMAAHFLRLLEAAGATPAQALLAGALDRAGPGRGTAGRSDHAQEVPSAAIRAPRGGTASSRRRAAGVGDRGNSGLRAFARRRQRHPYHSAGRRPSRDLGSGQLWLPFGDSGHAVPHWTGCGARAFRPADRCFRRLDAALFRRPGAHFPRRVLHGWRIRPPSGER